ncbi:hypothetical protein SERLA73DRAFT_68088 [Serpula lacrymans var. lacrymans S7.3]|uniref:DUF6532 domain-containing protein n=1 Tax=Serpula lacrymans var. lacrymans (strain S7.3) TaxID=936435 RepID=F8PGW7_SERL3|nr:hypothetical protein SERLA73DRAFT_68088 [Serpula lacrymans var. lacrymans S7.3]
MYRFTILALQVKILARILGQQPLPTELMDFHAQLVGIPSTLTPADLSALLDKVALSSMVPLSLSDSLPSVTMHQDLTTSSPAHSGEEQTQADESKLQTNQSLQQSLTLLLLLLHVNLVDLHLLHVDNLLLPLLQLLHVDGLVQGVELLSSNLSQLAAAHEDSSMFNSGEWAHSVNSLLTSVTSTNDYLDKSLASVVARSRCQDLPQPKPSKKQFEQWHAMGCKFAAILAGGVGTTSLVHFLTPLSDLDNILPHSQPPSPSLPPVVLPEMYVVSTTFQNMAEGNRQYSAPRDPGANYEWTESEREKASRAIKVTNVEDLTAKIQKHYDGGVRTNPSAYFSMPESIRTTLLPYFQSCLGSTTSLHHVDSAVKGEGFTFQALHFSWYNRHCTKLVPYTSKEIQDHANIYQKLKTVFADLFEWINEMLATYLPAKYLVLRQHAESLPGNNASAVCPFLGLVVNINVSTKAHRDAKDKLFCLVIPLEEESSQQVTPSPLLTQELDNPCYEQMVSSLHTNIQITASPAESVWLINVNRKMNSNSSPSLTPSRDSKAIITSFSPTSSRLAKAGHSQMCVILSTVKGFPGTDEQDELVWNAIIKVASSSSLFKTTIVDLENARNKQKKGRIVDYVWAAAAQLRGEVKQKARILILSEYTLKNKLSEEVHTIGEWLLSSRKGVFTFGGLDVFQKPFGHHIIKLLLQIQWFHKKGEGVRYPSDFKDSPLPLIALTVTAIKNCLHELAKGVHTTLNFSEQVYRPR